MKTKRRKVWVIWDKHGPCASYHRRDLAKQRLVRMNSHLAEEERETVVPMVERLPGDVVLSREQSAALKALAEWEGNSEEPVAWEYGLKPNPNCRKCGGKGVYTWQDGHNGDDHESDCDCTRAVALTVGQALAPFRGRR